MSNTTVQDDQAGASKLFAACFAALVATSFAFIIRIFVMGDWQTQFGLSETQKGEIFGAGLWPFGVSIVLFSLIIDLIGYRRSMIFAFAFHVASAIVLIMADGYNGLYLGSVLNGLAAGTVEAVINPAIASKYSKQKTKMLTILHAGWPLGIALGGCLIMLFGGHISWQAKVGIIMVPVITYGVLLLKAKFPVSERVVAGVSFRDMLREPGALGCLIVVYMIVMELNRVLGNGSLLVDTAFLDLPSLPGTIIILAITAAYFVYTRSLGQPMYVFLLLLMIILATTELGVDSWITDLMGPAMEAINIPAGWILVYSSTVMMILRFCIGPIEKALRPLGVLLIGSAIAAIGLYKLSAASGTIILVMATLYSAGKAFFWPVTLGLVSERFPKGGALTINAIAGVGMLGVGIIGGPLLGFMQDTTIDKSLKETPAIYSQVMSDEPKESIFGSYNAVDQAKLAALTPDDSKVVTAAVGSAKQKTMSTVAVLPATMAVCYLVLLGLFAARGGYKPVEIS